MAAGRKLEKRARSTATFVFQNEFLGARARVSAREFERVLFAKFRLRLQSTQSENSDG